MAVDTIVIDGDTAEFNPLQGGAVVTVKTGTIKGTGKSTIRGKNICIQGDESSVEVANCQYMTPSFPVPGKGTLKIASLAANQLTKKGTSSKKAMILKGAVFQSVFEVQQPAKLITPTGEVNDPLPLYNGVGRFILKNNNIKAT